MKFRALIIAFLFFASQAIQAATQTIQLAAGWNILALQVMPTDASPAAVFQPLGSNFVEAQTFDNQSKTWAVYRNPAKADATNLNSLQGLGMGPVVPGRGYFVFVSSATTLTLIGTEATAIPAITLYPGYNLVGFQLPSAFSTLPIGLADILNGPAYKLPMALEYDGSRYLPFLNDGIANDGAYLFSVSKGYFIYSDNPAPFTFTPEVAGTPPLVYLDGGKPIAVEAPVPNSGTTAAVNLLIKLTRNYTGSIRFFLTGTARYGVDYTVPAYNPTTNQGSFNVATGTSSVVLPVTIKDRKRLQNNNTIVLTLSRPQETTGQAAEAASLPQVAEIDITDGASGIYEALVSSSTGSSLTAQNLRVALRGNGQAIFDPQEGGWCTSQFGMQYTMAAGLPQFQGGDTVVLDSNRALGRQMSLTILPGVTTVKTDNPPGQMPSFVTPITLQIQNLVGGVVSQIPANLSLTQGNPMP